MSQSMDPRVQEPVTGPVRPATQAKRGSTLLNALLGIALVAAVGGVAFATGRLTAPAAATFPNGGPGGGNLPGGPGASFSPGGGNQPGGGLFGAGGVTLEGTVESMSGDSLTIRTTSGQSVEVTLPADTTYHAQGTASSDDVTSGATVLIRVDLQAGQGNNGITANDVTIVP